MNRLSLVSLLEVLRRAPVMVVFVSSLLLSAIARAGQLINRDGILYIEVARAFQQQGFDAAMAMFPWPFFSIAIAFVSSLTGLGLESAGYLLNAMLFAGACALIIDISRRWMPDMVWPVILTLLALPGLNEYRHELLREYGAWFFIMLALWLAVRFAEKPRWLTAQAILPVLGFGALFRPEALVMFPAVLFWQMLASPPGERLRRTWMVAGPAALFGVGALVYFVASPFFDQTRFAGDVARYGLQTLNGKITNVAAVLPDYAGKFVPSILIYGSLALVPERYVVKLGFFVLPLLYLFFSGHFREAFRKNKLLMLAFCAHVLVAGYFALNTQFLAGRYVALLYLFSVPMLGYAIATWLSTRPSFKIPLVLVGILLMFANVISLSPQKTHFVDAGRWLAEQSVDVSSLYIESGRTAYYAGMNSQFPGPPIDNRASLAEEVRMGRYELLVLEVSRKESSIDAWLEAADLAVIKRFATDDGDAVIVAAPKAEK